MKTRVVYYHIFIGFVLIALSNGVEWELRKTVIETSSCMYYVIVYAT